MRSQIHSDTIGEAKIMVQYEASAQSARRRRRNRIASAVAVCLVAAAALIAPYVAHTAHAAAPKATCAQPPAGKDPTTFTKQQLQTYGLPLRLPHQDQATWANMIRHAKHRMCTPQSIKPLSHLLHHAPTQGMTPATPATGESRFSFCDNCWAGYEAYGANYNFTNVWGTWQVPCVPTNAPLPTPDSGDTYAFGPWIGLGGDAIFDPNANLVQTGIGVHAQTSTIYGAHSVPIVQTTYTYQAWVENTGTYMAGQAFYYFNVNCGDWIMAEVQAPDTLWIGDFQNNGYTDVSYGPAAGTDEAECTIEEPTEAVGLLDFGTQTFTQCLAYDANSNTFGALNLFNDKVNSMTRPLTINLPLGLTYTIETPMTSTGPIDTSNSNGSFSVTWLSS
jgi:hypothetical protein